MTSNSGFLYVVATPIGNLSDISARALDILSKVDLIAAEDTRHTKRLLSHHQIENRLISLHDHNESQQLKLLVERIKNGESIALVSDAGTPLISDPGYKLVHELRSKGYRIIPIPGACALVAALSVSGLATDSFVFEGFLPSKAQARVKMLSSLKNEARTMIFYESTHRIKSSVSDMTSVFGAGRRACIARELTKTFETVHTNQLGMLMEILNADALQTKGEFVVMVAGNQLTQTADECEADRMVDILMKSLSITQSTSLVAEITGLRKKELYQRALQRKE